MRIYKKLVVLLVGIGITFFSNGQATKTAAPPVTLKVGDKAPPLNATWLKGKPPGTFGDGKVHVVEFWATWCGPCRMNMPHLSRLAQKYKDQVTVTSVSIWEASHIKDKSFDYQRKVKAFVDNSHDMMDYSVGVDDQEETIGNTWMKASGQKGIPSAFVIDQEGRIAWIGAPFAGIDDVVQLVIDKKLDASAVSKVRADYRARLDEHRKFQKESEEALKSGDYEKALVAAEAAIKVAPVFDDYVIPLKYEALDGMDREKGRAYARQVMKTHKNAPVLLINMWARKLLNENYKNADYQIALELMQAGMRYVDPGEGLQAGLLAEAYFKTGNVKKAIETQEMVLRSMDDPIRETTAVEKERAQKKLETYSTSTAMTIKGQLKGKGVQGKKVLLTRPAIGAAVVDSAIIGLDGSFQLYASFPSPQMMALVIKDDNGPLQGNWNPAILFFAENSNIKMEGNYDSLIKEQGFRALYYGELSPSTVVKGSKSHDLFLKYYHPKNKLDKERDKAFMEYIGYLNPGKGKSKGPKEEGIAISGKVEALDKARKDFLMKYILSNPTSEVLAYIAEQTIKLKNLSVDEVGKLIGKFSNQPSPGPMTEDFLKKAAIAKKTAVGTSLVDFALIDVEGNQHKLSDYVGKGKYVLVEFWASWCGPCRADIPHLKKTFNSYHSKGFDIVSVSLDEKHDAWVKAMKDENLTQWPQLLEPKAFNSELTATYRINGIPACLLFDPSGKLVTYNMRGSFMDAILIQLYGEPLEMLIQ